MGPEEVKEIEGYFKEFDKCTIGYGVAVRIVNKVPALLAALKEKETRIQKMREALRDVSEVAKYSLWHSEIGNIKAQQLIDEIHKGKWKISPEGIWPQVETLLSADEESR